MIKAKQIDVIVNGVIAKEVIKVELKKKAKQIEQIAEIIYDETLLNWEVCTLCAERIVNEDWRK